MTTVVISSSQFLESFEFISRLAGNLEDKLTLRTLVVDRLIVFDLGRDFRQKKCIELFLRKAHDIKIEINVLKFTELDAKKLFVPPGVECQLIVGNAQCFLLRVGEPLQADRRHFLRECQDFCVWGGYSRGSPTRLPFVFCDAVCQT